jgi:two-component system, chemotaxis family, protein-glutamate methylesterase/glutaminase
MQRTAAPAEGVVAIGASAGGVEALTRLMAGLPADFPLAVMVVVHMSPGMASVLAKILGRSGPLPALPAEDGTVLQGGRIYAAVPDWHLLTRGRRVALSDGAPQHGLRPAIDALFRSVAAECGPHAIGVLLSGLLDDGVAGLRAIRAGGGITVVQESTDAMFADLPRNAIDAGLADHTAAAAEIGALLLRLIHHQPKHVAIQ